ncbi:MAG: cupin domain-containing protein [Chloroflexi bacterium]|nr:cupin domain-containing protein [Chloroflexota bacterium]
MNYTILHRDDLPHDGSAYEFQGYLHGDTKVSFIWVDMLPGDGVRLHKHPYEEVFIVQEGQATFTVGSDTLEAKAGNIVIVPPGLPHKFLNSGEGPLRQIDIHRSPQFITEWLEERTRL